MSGCSGAEAVELRKAPAAVSRPRILSVCCLYPNPFSPAQGIFVQRRLEHLAKIAGVLVVSPVALVQYGKPRGQKLAFGSKAPLRERREGRVPVQYPRWFYPPLSGSLTPLWLAARLLPELSRIHRTFAFDIVDAHFGHPEGIAAALVARRLSVPFTITLRGNEPKHSRGPLGKFLMGWALRRASAIFAVSGRLRDFAIGLGANPGKVFVIPNGVDSAVFFPRDRDACRQKFGLSTERPVIVSAGALVERKGHHRIIQAIASMPKGATRPQLAIAGGPGPEGAYENELRGLVASLGLEEEVRFIGHVDAERLAELMCAADIFCLASSNEGWPNVLHEALACGTPAVATDVGAVPEMLAGGRCGLVAPVNDQQGLRDALEHALAKEWDRESIAEWGRARGWNHVAAEVLEQFEGILREKRAVAQVGEKI